MILILLIGGAAIPFLILSVRNETRKQNDINERLLKIQSPEEYKKFKREEYFNDLFSPTGIFSILLWISIIMYFFSRIFS